MFNIFYKKISLLRQTFLKRINKNYYSQFGEDKILDELIPKDFNNGFYVDVGCGHPVKNNNTYLLNKKGWYGINIDLDNENINLFDIYRPSDQNISSCNIR